MPRAHDMGIPQLDTFCKVVVHVLDVNDHSPVFDVPPPPGELSVREDAVAGHVVYQLRASDGDASPPNNEIYYRCS